MQKEGYFIALNSKIEIGPVAFTKLLSHFKDLENVWQANHLELKKAGLTEKQIKAVREVVKNTDPSAELEKLNKLGIKFVLIKNKDYPKLLAEIPDPPPVLYYKGILPKDDEFLFAVVGSRACTYYGRQVTEDIVYNLAKSGLIIVSGLALGIDGLAHQAALKANGKTVAVLACGLDQIYPYAHKKIADEIIEKEGAIISENHLGTKPLRAFFPLRNRIISGLSRATLIIEAALRSGALITARTALEQNREVFAVPGSIYSQTSQGTNNLIKMGAYPVTSDGGILLELNIKVEDKQIKGKKRSKGDNKEEEILLSLLSFEPTLADDLVLKSKLDIALVNSTLIMLEIRGMVKNIGGGQYIKT